MNARRMIVPVLILLLLAAGGAAFYFYQKAAVSKTDPSVSAQKETADLIARVGALIVLPEGETPTIATVSDPDKLKDQAFFANAKAGDKVLVYTNARKAFLYDPVNNKLLNVAPLNIGTQASSTTSPQ